VVDCLKLLADGKETETTWNLLIELIGRGKHSMNRKKNRVDWSRIDRCCILEFKVKGKNDEGPDKLLIDN
jgi:hypothetical protein